VMIDVREPDEIAVIATESARIYPMSELDPSSFEAKSGLAKSSHIYVLCRSGGRSMRVAAALEAQGFKHIYNIEGGILAWSAAGLPVKPQS
ncbi:MAG: rhodanese-like domain-containing protein, partial [Proteobacteria bacterium]|nr:rhodanese-like domain-containing protein [Pseudomonadota bacterium]